MVCQFRRLKPGVVEIGDLYLAANSNMSLKPAIVTYVDENGFGYQGEYFGGNATYDSDRGILIKQTEEGGLELFVEEETLREFQERLGIPVVEEEIKIIE